jgi:hypothetical protein
MNIIYIAYLPVLDDSLGVLKKIIGQSECLNANGVGIHVVVFYKDDSNYLDYNTFPKYFELIKYPYYGIKRPLQLLLLWNNISMLAQKSEYDLVYFRYPGASYFLYRLLKNNKNKIILEHNSNELFEIKMRSRKPKFDVWKEKYFAKISFKYALGNVGKSSDFASHQEFKVGYKLNLKTITNGVFVRDFNSVETPKNKSKNSISIIFVGNISKWHGLERLFIGIKNNNSKIKYKLYLVGKKEVFLDLINKYDLNRLINDKIRLTGFKTGYELNELFNKADFAIGSLGLHRLQIFNGVPLKHREYLSRGIPFVYSGNDEDIKEEIAPLLYNIIPDETPIDFDDLLKFIIIQRKNSVDVSKKLISFAYKSVDIKNKTLELNDYFEERLKHKKTIE